MSRTISRLASAFLALTLCALPAFGQGTTGSLTGTVTDSSGALLAGASVSVKGESGVEQTVQTNDTGSFTVPALGTGLYTVTVTSQGFKQSVVTGVKIDVGTASSISVALEVGAPTEVVTITGVGGELLRTQDANVSTTITGRQITDLPFTSRDALDLVLLLPGTATVGRPRSSSVNGLPKGALNITLDGINVQDNLLKSNDGFFTYIRPRIDAIDEVTLSTATPGAESSGEGAVQIKFATRGGTNDLNGSLYWYHRNPALNANYYFNNLAGLPRDRVLLNQYGGRAGGPVWIPGLYDGRDKSFWFVNYEEFRLPEQVTRQRNVLNPAAQGGVFTYGTGATQRTVNLLTLAAATDCNTTAAGLQPCTSTVDPLIGQTLAAIRASTAQGSLAALDANRQIFSFTNTGGQNRYFTTVRLDHNITDKHRVENVWNYQAFRNAVDFLNNVDAPFPGFSAGTGGQNSNRWSNSTALRSTLGANLVNEARVGLVGGVSLFRTELTPSAFAPLGGFTFGTAVGTGGFAVAGLNNPNAVRTNQWRNSPVKQFQNTLTWVRGTHSINFGGSFTQINTYAKSFNALVPSITLGLDGNDPAAAIFTAANFPGASNADITAAANIYSLLTGRVTAVAGAAFLNEETGQYTNLGDFTDRIRQREFGLFAQDSWRFRPNLTLNFGLRWEVQLPFTALNDNYSFAPYADAFGVSGAGNLFQPGASGGRVPQFTQFEAGTPAYDTDWSNFGPSLGIAYSPNWNHGLLRRLFGDGGQSVIRAGYSVAFVREGTNVATTGLGTNPGGTFTTTRNTASAGAFNLPAGTLLRNLTPATALAAPPSAPAYPFVSTNATDQIVGIDPNLKLGSVQSWTFGIQRELTKDTVVEARYVGNRGQDLWRLYFLNETNVVENGFVNEFRLAQQNLLANIAAGRGTNFRYFGPGTGTSPLPVTVAYIAGTANPNLTTSYSNALFANATLVGNLSPNAAVPQAFAANIFGNAGRRANALAAGLPANFFIVNPDMPGGAFVVENAGSSSYDAFTFEVRRRMARGLLIQGSYTFGKALSDMFASSAIVQSNYTSLRDRSLDKGAAPFDIRHGFKANWIYELPVGRGRSLLSDANGVVDRLLGGWEIHGTARVQSGSPFSLGNVQLVGMTRDQLQDMVEVRRDPSGTVFYLPDDLILNTRRAFNVTANGFSALGAPTGQFIAPAGSNGCTPAYGGACGVANVVLYGPRFTRTDLSVVKKTRLTETTNFEFRAELLNAFNAINFRVGSPAADVVAVGNFNAANFGQTTNAYQDISTTNDTGARLIQFVVRLNF